MPDSSCRVALPEGDFQRDHAFIKRAEPHSRRTAVRVAAVSEPQICLEWPTSLREATKHSDCRMTEHLIQDLLGELTPVHKRIAPQTLYVAGDVDLVRHSPKVAVVGSRKATSEGLDHATRVTRTLVNLDTTVVSGLAVGIDTVAHRTTIEAGGRTFAVIGTGFDRAYPAKNRALQAYLATHFAIVSQFAPGSRVTPANFPQRNRTMALLSDALVIVEAAEKSGTINQAWEALRIGRTVLLLETVADNPALTWPRKMQYYGAEVLRLSHLEDQLRDIPWVTAFGEPIF